MECGEVVKNARNGVIQEPDLFQTFRLVSRMKSNEREAKTGPVQRPRSHHLNTAARFLGIFVWRSF